MKRFKAFQVSGDLLEPEKLSKLVNPLLINSLFMFNQKCYIKSLPQSLNKLTLDLRSSKEYDKPCLLHILKKVRVLNQLDIIVRNNVSQLQPYLVSLQFACIKSLRLTLKHFSLFQEDSIRELWDILGRNLLQNLSITIKYPSDMGGNNMISFFRNSVSQFNDKNFRVLSRKISSLPKLKHLELNFMSSHFIDLTKKSFIYMSNLMKNLHSLSSLHLNTSFKDINYESLNQFSVVLSKKINLKSLRLHLKGFKNVSPEPLFNAISKLCDLNALSIENDCGWDESNIQDFAASCERLNNLKSFHFSYAPSEKMAYNPLFRTTLSKLTELRELSLTLSTIYEPELFDLSHSLQYLVNLEKIEFCFLTENFSLKNMKRLSGSIASLEKLKDLSLKFAQCKFECGLLLMMADLFKSLKNIQEMTLYLLSSKETNQSNERQGQFSLDILNSLEDAKNLQKLDLKVDGTGSHFDNTESLVHFFKQHEKLRVLKMGLLELTLDDETKKTLERFIQKEKPSDLTTFSLYNQKETLFEF